MCVYSSTLYRENNMLAKCVLLLLCYHQLLGGAVSEFTPTVYGIESTAECGQYNPLNDEQLNQVLRQVQQRLPTSTLSDPQLNQNTTLPKHNSSCKSILDRFPSAPSGYYNIITTNSNITALVYCDMEGTNCGGEGGWTRVAYVNMTQPGATCPQGLNQGPSYYGKTCANFYKFGCTGTLFPTQVEYSKVCGQVRGYQLDAPGAFQPYNDNTNLTIDDSYVYGASITYGNTPRKHIWTYAAAPRDAAHLTDNLNCPCKTNSEAIAPPYVGTDYYCESGRHTCCVASVDFHDPLWDGQQCGGGEAPCCTHPNMPWFIKTLNETTTEDIELRVCEDSISYGGNTSPLDIIELFVQ